MIALAEHAHIRRCLDRGVDCIKVAVDAARERNLETFYTCRGNGSDWLSDGKPARIGLEDARSGRVPGAMIEQVELDGRYGR
ncbi:MAG: hypothetical protein VX346_29165 [Planctomycetota bacterium]|nr:hypothetical protein [Planctomycetota bacterium]